MARPSASAIADERGGEDLAERAGIAARWRGRAHAGQADSNGARQADKADVRCCRAMLRRLLVLASYVYLS